MWLPRITHAEHFSIHHYGIPDGLPHNRVNCIHQDPRGYLWLGTWEGLSRFDGYRFVNYGIGDGLENSLINDIAEDRDGHLWVATHGGGVARLVDDPREQFSTQADANTTADGQLRQSAASDDHGYPVVA